MTGGFEEVLTSVEQNDQPFMIMMRGLHSLGRPAVGFMEKASAQMSNGHGCSGNRVMMVPEQRFAVLQVGL